MTRLRIGRELQINAKLQVKLPQVCIGQAGSAGNYYILWPETGVVDPAAVSTGAGQARGCGNPMAFDLQCDLKIDSRCIALRRWAAVIGPASCDAHSSRSASTVEDLDVQILSGLGDRRACSWTWQTPKTQYGPIHPRPFIRQSHAAMIPWKKKSP